MRIDAKPYEHLRSDAESWGLSLEAALLGALFVGRVSRRELPIVARRDELDCWNELRVAKHAWGQTAKGLEFAEDVTRIWERTNRELTPEWRDIVSQTPPADIVALSGSLPILTHAHLWTTPALGFPETHGLLFYLWHLLLPDPLGEATIYYKEALFGSLLQQATHDAVAADAIVGGLILYADGASWAQNEGVRRIQMELLEVGSRRKPPYVAADEFREVQIEKSDFYLAHELSRLAGLSLDEVMQKGFRGELASRHGYSRDLGHYIEKEVRRHKLMVRDDEEAEHLDQMTVENYRADIPGWISAPPSLDYLMIGRVLEEVAPQITELLGPKGVPVLLAYWRESDATQKEIAKRAGCSIRTVQRAIKAIEKNHETLKGLLDLPTTQ